MSFPENFTWGVAAASYQIEGAATEEGKGLSVWDMLVRQPGRIHGGQNGNVACDHYHRSQEDTRLMQEIGVPAYRLSLSWPRILPEGTGRINPAGLAFYDRLIDDLLAAGITPWVTLFHWDYPYELFCRGGWLNRDCVEWFAEYTQVVVERLSDRVRHWMTLNEPQCFIGFGHVTGIHAPGLRLGMAETLRAAHHVLMAHGRSVQVLRAHAKTPPTVGWAPVGVTSLPFDADSPQDIAAARRAMFSITGGDPAATPHLINIWSNTWWGDPVILGHYPEDGLAAAGSAMPKIAAGDLELISQPLDFYGTNIYNGTIYRADAGGGPEIVPHSERTSLTGFKWPVVPESLRWGPRFLHERYGLPVVVTENGAALPDWVSLDGKAHDPQRIDFLNRYLLQLRQAISDGADVRGYFQWSIMDNFEWAEGFKERFGLIHVDYTTLRRTIKDSGFWYREVIASNGGTLPS